MAPFRVGRTLDGSIDNLVEQVEMSAAKRKETAIPRWRPRSRRSKRRAPIEMKKLEAQKAEADGKQQLEMAKLQSQNQVETQKLQGEFRIAMFEAESKRQENMAKVQQTQAKMQQDAAKHQQTLVEGQQKMALNTQMVAAEADGCAEPQADMAARPRNERGQLFKEKQAAMKPYPTVGGR